MSRQYFQSTITTTLVLLLALTTTLAQTDDSIVYDTYGEPLKPGQSYYIVPTTYNDVGGGLKPLPIDSKVCPVTFYVSQEDDNTNFGDAIVFSTTSKYVSLSSKVQIRFARFPPLYVLCFRYFPSGWGISQYNSNYIVEVNRFEGDGSLFTIEDDEQGNYQIHVCVNRKKCGGLSFLSDAYDKPVLGVNFTTPTSFVFEPNPFFSPRSIKSARKSPQALCSAMEYYALIEVLLLQLN